MICKAKLTNRTTNEYQQADGLSCENSHLNWKFSGTPFTHMLMDRKTRTEIAYVNSILSEIAIFLVGSG